MHNKYILIKYYMLSYAKYLKAKSMLQGQTGRIKKELRKVNVK